jgi:hypothetical protein
MSKRKFRIRRPSNFRVASTAYYAEKDVPSSQHVQYLRDPRLTREDGGKVRAVFYNENLTPVFK